MNNKRFLLFFVLIFALAAVFSGCVKSWEQRSAEKYIESQTGMNVNVKDEGFTIKDGEGNEFSLTQEQEIPESWPNNVTYYKKGVIESASVLALPGGKTFSLLVYTDDSFGEVVSYFKDEFEKQGFKTVLDMTTGDSSLLGFEKDDLSSTVGISVNKGKIEITQTLNEKTEE